MKHFNQLSKILLIVVAIVGLAIGMSTVTGYNNSSDNINTTISAENSLMDSKCDAGKCGGDNVKAAVSDKVDDAKADVKEAKCGEGKSDEGKCGEGKCGVDDAKAAVSDKVDEAKCGEGKCG